MALRNVLSFQEIENARKTKPYHFDIMHGVRRGLTMNVFNPHGGLRNLS